MFSKVYCFLARAFCNKKPDVFCNKLLSYFSDETTVVFRNNVCGVL